MRQKTFLLFVAIFAALSLASGCAAHRSFAAKIHKAANGESNQSSDDSAFTAREEIRQSFTFAPNARVEIAGINGSLDVETTDGNAAEIVIVRLAKNPDTLVKRKTKINFENNSLYIRCNQRESQGIWDSLTESGELRTRATLKLPRSIEFIASGVNGKVNIGAVDGMVEMHGINGQLKIAKAVGRLELSGINGKSEVAVSKLSNDGININGINGNIDLRFLDEVNANLQVNGINGRVNTDLPSLKVEEQKHNNYRAVLGAGGTQIEVSGMNGNLSLSSATANTRPVKSVEIAATPEAKSAKTN